jgi:hypothetical protein
MVTFELCLLDYYYFLGLSDCSLPDLAICMIESSVVPGQHGYTECVFWNLLDSRNEEGVPLMAMVEWLRFIQCLSRLDAGSNDKTGLIFHDNRQ